LPISPVRSILFKMSSVLQKFVIRLKLTNSTNKSLKKMTRLKILLTWSKISELDSGMKKLSSNK
jgi:hypothetical protein